MTGTASMRRSVPSVVVLVVLTVALALPARASELTHTVSSGDLGPAREVVVEVGGGDRERVVFDFDTAVSSWGGRALVFRGREGSSSFEARYFIRRAGRWHPITDEITSDRGWAFGRVGSSAHVTIRLVVFVTPPHRWGVVDERRFPVQVGTPVRTFAVATGTVRSHRWE